MPLRSRPGHDVEGRSRDGLVGALHLGTLGRSQFVFQCTPIVHRKKPFYLKSNQKACIQAILEIVQQCVDAT